MQQPKRQRSLGRAGARCAIFCALLFACVSNAAAQSAKTLSQVRKIYIEPFGQGNGITELMDRTIEELQRKGKLEVVKAREEADAVIQGSGSIWLTGYVSTDFHSPTTTRQPVFQGFLSVEFIGKDNDPLWSYLVTPGKFRAGDITKDLADRLVDKFLEARQQSEATQSARVTEMAGQIVLTAAGATFPAPLYQKWFESFHQRHPNIAIEYSPVGSEAGIELLMNGKVDFAASDVRLSDDRMAQSRRTFLYFATVIGAVVPVYNLKGIGRNLNFTADVLAGIYLGKIRKWNDTAIRESNPNTALPDKEIVVIHRSDGSGTTSAWTDYLSKVSPEWKASIGSGTVVPWPMGIGAQGNEGVAIAIQQTANSVGYVELAYALQHQLGFGAVRNSAGRFIQADLASVSAAGLNAAGTLGSDALVSITNAPGKGAYPIATFTWWVVPQDVGGDKHTALEELLQWMLSSGQRECSALAYTPLPREVANRQLQLLDQSK
jgi:phosphate transport system substrate-binding protein